MRRIISMLLANEAGSLARVAGMFSARGYNIDSLTVAATHDLAVSRLTLVTTGDDVVIAQIIKQSRKLVDVIEIADLTTRDHLEYELMIVKVATDSAAQLATFVQKHARAMVVADEATTRTIQFTGTGAELDAILSELAGIANILDVARSGAAALDCSALSLSEVAA